MHENFLIHALALAEERKGFTAPNPSVGAVLVRDQQIIAEGNHQTAGAPHAEVMAIRNCPNPAGATLYVTLEPCCHFGKTPPCTELIIESNIKKVVYAYRDPNPLVSGEGIRQLEATGIQCEHMALPEINAFYQSYAYWSEQKRPWVTAKLAISMDGKIAGAGGCPIKITSRDTDHFTHEQRLRSDAILSTAKTIIADDPSLNVRLKESINKPIYLLDSNIKLPTHYQIFNTAESLTLLYNKLDPYRLDAMQKKGVSCVSVGESGDGLDLYQVMEKIGERGVHDLWVEAGGTCFKGLIEAGLVNRAFLYIAPQTLGSDALSGFMGTRNLFDGIKSVNWRAIGPDAVCEMKW